MATSKLDAAMKRISTRALATFVLYLTLTCLVAGCDAEGDFSEVESESIEQGVQSGRLITIDDLVGCSVGKKGGMSFYDCSKAACDGKCSSLGFARSKVVNHKYGTTCDTSKEYGLRRRVRCSCSLLKVL